MKNFRNWVKPIFIVISGWCLLPLSPATMALAEPLLLVATTTTFNAIGVKQAVYYFTLQVPANSREPLQKVTFTQRQGLEQIHFDESGSYAFEGTSNRKGEKLAIALSTNDRQNQTTTVTFNKPLAPGQIVTIALRPFRNPIYEGVYLFELTTLPSSPSTQAQTIGIGRLQFYQD